MLTPGQPRASPDEVEQLEAAAAHMHPLAAAILGGALGDDAGVLDIGVDISASGNGSAPTAAQARVPPSESRFAKLRTFFRKK
jgi:hypothetical protein